MNIPTNLKYTKDHEWISMDGNIATIGITDFAQSELGDIVYVEVETLDQNLDKDEVFGTVEAVKTVSDLFLPLSGEIIEFNEESAKKCSLSKDNFEKIVEELKTSLANFNYTAKELDPRLSRETLEMIVEGMHKRAARVL